MPSRGYQPHLTETTKSTLKWNRQSLRLKTFHESAIPHATHYYDMSHVEYGALLCMYLCRMHSIALAMVSLSTLVVILTMLGIIAVPSETLLRKQSKKIARAFYANTVFEPKKERPKPWSFFFADCFVTGDF